MLLNSLQTLLENGDGTIPSSKKLRIFIRVAAFQTFCLNVTSYDFWDQGSGKGRLQVLVTFDDIAASFSEEEWKLLHKWQEELFKNVMNEIHQVLNSLGPLIATSVFSLRPKVKQDPSWVNNEDSERRDSIAQSPGFLSLNSDDVVRTEQNMDVSFVASLCVNGGDNNTDVLEENAALTLVNPVIIKEEGELCYMAHQETVGRGTYCTSVGTGVTSVLSLRCNKEETNVEEEPGPKEKNSGADPTNRREKRHSLIYPETIHSDALRNLENWEHQNLEFVAVSRSQNGSTETLNQQEEREAQSENDFHRLAHSDLLPSFPKTAVKDTVIEHKSDVCNRKKRLTCQPNTKQSKRHYPCADCGNFFLQKEELLIHAKTHHHLRSSQLSSVETVTSTEMLDQPIEVETDFDQSARFLSHQLNDLSKKQHQSSKSEENMCNKRSLVRHQRARTKESVKRFRCTECGKAFSYMGKLIVHERTHTGERPYQCIQCLKTFVQKGHLVIHARRHRGEKPFKCKECEKCFTQKGELTSHEKTHKGERPYPCTVCGKRFSRKLNVTRHARIHTAS